MKANRFLPHSSFALLTAYILSAASLQAQTFTGQSGLIASPAHLEATVYPVTNAQSTIKVIFNNRTGGYVRVVIRDEKGHIFYDEQESIAFYRRRFDLSALPSGNYKVELSKQNEQYTQGFVIKPPVESYIALESSSVQTTPEKSADKKLISSQ